MPDRNAYAENPNIVCQPKRHARVKGCVAVACDRAVVLRGPSVMRMGVFVNTGLLREAFQCVFGQTKYLWLMSQPVSHDLRRHVTRPQGNPPVYGGRAGSVGAIITILIRN